MSEFLATARIVVRPDTSQFRTDLEAQLKSVTQRPIPIPIIPVVGPGFAAATAGSAAFAAAQGQAAIATSQSAAALAAATTITRQYTGVVDLSVVATQALAAAQEREAITATQAAGAQAAHARSMSQLARGGGASLLTLFGLRGATLAASGAFLAGTAAVVGFSKAVQSAAALETELNVFKVTAGATATEMDRVSASAKALGRDITLPGVTASTAATAMTELAKAGLSVRDSLDGARGVLQLATAAQIDVKASTELVAGALNAFALNGDDAVKVADLLTGAAKESQGEITDMATALGQAAAVSRQFGVSIEDTVTLLTELAQAGIAGGRAGTSLRVAFLRLVNPPAAAAKALKELNVQIRDADGNLRPEVFTDIQAALQGYTKAQQDATLATIFGSDAIRTAAIIGTKGSQAFLQTRDAITEAGLAQEAAAARTAGLAGDVENLSNQAAGLGLTIGEVAKGPISLFVKTLAESVSTMNDAASGLVALGKLFGDLGEKASDAVPGLGFVGKGLDDIAVASVKFGPVLAPFTAVAGVAKQFGVNAEQSGKQAKVFGDIADSVTESVNALTSALSQSAAALKAVEPQDTGLNVTNIQNIVGGFDAKEVRARIKGNNQELLSVLGQEQAFLEAQLQRDYVKNRPALKRALEQQLLGVVGDIRAVQSQAKSDAEKLKREAEQAARDAAQAVRDQEQALLAQFGLARDQQQNEIAAAEAKAGLQDDIREQKELRVLVLAQIAAIKQRISIEGGRNSAITALQAILIQVNRSLSSLAQQQQAAAEERRQELLRGISLDVELAQITDNQVAEVNARNKKIGVLQQALKREAQLHGKTTVAYKEIRNEIAQERAAIEEIRKEKQKENQSFAQASFEFLQAQTGFASTLLGNLIPRGLTGGLVGGGAPVQSAIQPVAGAVEARSMSGPTAGQGNATNHLLQQILAQLKELNGETKAPEARRQHSWSLTTMDGVGGG